MSCAVTRTCLADQPTTVCPRPATLRNALEHTLDSQGDGMVPVWGASEAGAQ